MIENNKYTINCPSAADYSNYISGKASKQDIVEFEQHLETCELCRDAVSGLKSNFLFNGLVRKSNTPIYKISKQTLWMRRVGYAASIALLIGFGSTLLKQQKSNATSKPTADKLAYVYNHGNNTETKTLNHKSSGDYWYIGEEQSLVVNDQIIDMQEVENATAKTQEKRIFVQVESKDQQFNEYIISKLKSFTSEAVLAYSKTHWRNKE